MATFSCKGLLPPPRFLAALSLAVLYSCGKGSEPAILVSPAAPYAVSLSEAQMAAEHSSNSLLVKGLLKNGKNGAAKHEVVAAIPVPNQSQPSFYIFDYKDGGYIILSADRRVEPVLAYSATGGYQKSGTLPYGLAAWMTKKLEGFQELRKHNELGVPATVAAQWAELLAAPPTDLDGTASRPMPDPTPCQSSSSTETVGPLLATQWGQGCDYNDYCPASSNTTYCSHTPTGCVATAMAQIMYHWKYPAATFSWSAMPLNYGNPAVATLMAQCGQNVAMNYTPTESGTQAYLIGDALRDIYHYSSVTWGDYDFGSVKGNMRIGEPLVLQGFTDHTYGGWWWQTEYGDGSGHAWVCDGFQENKYFDCSSGTGGGSAMLHMNWGWNEWWAGGSAAYNYNGWYNESNWTVANYNFQYIKKMVYNIHP